MKQQEFAIGRKAEDLAARTGLAKDRLLKDIQHFGCRPQRFNSRDRLHIELQPVRVHGVVVKGGHLGVEQPVELLAQRVVVFLASQVVIKIEQIQICLLYTSDAADE